MIPGDIGERDTSYQVGKDEGGSIRVTDPQAVALFEQLVRLFHDPDAFGTVDVPAA